MKKLALALGCLFVTGCASYVTPLCDDTNRRDLPNFEGAFTTVLTQVDKTGSHTERYEFEISRVARGEYLVEHHDGATHANLCEIASHYYLENNQSWITGIPVKGYLAFQVSANGDNSFDLTALGLDSKVLADQGIKFDLVENHTKKDAPDDKDFSSILAYNAGVPAEQFVQILEPQSFKLTLRPGGNRLAKAALAHIHGKSSKFN